MPSKAPASWPWPEQTALFVAHPGHELRIWHWLETVRPVAFVITDGSGRHGVPRLATTERLLSTAGASRGSVFGALSDREIYHAVLTGRVEVFQGLVDELARSLTEADVVCIVGDAAEGQIMAHDLLREVRVEAVKRASAALGREIEEYEFTLDAKPSFVPPGIGSRNRHVFLGPEALQRKVQIALSYKEVQSFVVEAFEQWGEEVFGAENFFPSLPGSCLPTDGSTTFRYERYGEEQVAAGNYTQAIRFQDHIAPIVAALREAA